MADMCTAAMSEEEAGLGQRLEMLYLTADGKGQRKKDEPRLRLRRSTSGGRPSARLRHTSTC